MKQSNDLLTNQCPVGKKKPIALPLIVLIILGNLSNPAHALVLYVDRETNQVYTTPGKNRVKLGKFMQVDEDTTEQAAEELKEIDAIH